MFLLKVHGQIYFKKKRTKKPVGHEKMAICFAEIQVKDLYRKYSNSLRWTLLGF